MPASLIGSIVEQKALFAWRQLAMKQDMSVIFLTGSSDLKGITAFFD
jgi:hypothetical protein